jgi:hypothetical protein
VKQLLRARAAQAPASTATRVGALLWSDGARRCHRTRGVPTGWSGPGDHSDRFGYWPIRFTHGGRVVVPDVSEQLTQHIDVRDLAASVVDAAERGLVGTFDAIGPAVPLPGLLADVA